MTIGVIATIKVQAGKNKQFEAEFNELARQVLDKEAGCVFYALHRSQTDPQTYKVLEQYQTPEDLEAHGKTAYFQEANTKLGALVAAAPNIEVLDGV